MGKLNYLSTCGITLILGPILIILLYSTNLVQTTSSSWHFINTIGPVAAITGFILLIFGLVKAKDRNKLSKVRIPSTSSYKKKLRFGCLECESAYKIVLKKCPDCGTKLI